MNASITVKIEEREAVCEVFYFVMEDGDLHAIILPEIPTAIPIHATYCDVTNKWHSVDDSRVTGLVLKAMIPFPSGISIKDAIRERNAFQAIEDLMIGQRAKRYLKYVAKGSV